MVSALESVYAKTSGGWISYQVVGAGPPDVLVTKPPFLPVDLMWDEPRLARFLNGLSSFSRHIWFDSRGMPSRSRAPLVVSAKTMREGVSSHSPSSPPPPSRCRPSRASSANRENTARKSGSLSSARALLISTPLPCCARIVRRRSGS
jgi:hypothetical protein